MTRSSSLMFVAAALVTPQALSACVEVSRQDVDVCELGERRCNGSAVEVCKAEGWVAEKDCEPEEVCEEGECYGSGNCVDIVWCKDACAGDDACWADCVSLGGRVARERFVSLSQCTSKHACDGTAAERVECVRTHCSAATVDCLAGSDSGDQGCDEIVMEVMADCPAPMESSCYQQCMAKGAPAEIVTAAHVFGCWSDNDCMGRACLDDPDSECRTIMSDCFGDLPSAPEP